MKIQLSKAQWLPSLPIVILKNMTFCMVLQIHSDFLTNCMYLEWKFVFSKTVIVKLSGTKDPLQCLANSADHLPKIISTHLPLTLNSRNF